MSQLVALDITFTGELPLADIVRHLCERGWTHVYEGATLLVPAEAEDDCDWALVRGLDSDAAVAAVEARAARGRCAGMRLYHPETDSGGELTQRDPCRLTLAPSLNRRTLSGGRFTDTSFYAERLLVDLRGARAGVRTIEWLDDGS